MEQTLGKRIVTYRKRAGLTQDQLAEQLGVTAQAVSKWENDQSCPDISILPKLADIFGVSVDALLGRQEPARPAEIVEEDESNGLHIQSDKGHFDFHFDSGRRFAFGIAILVLLSGALLLAAQLLEWQVTLWDILWPSALLVFGLSGLYPKLSFFRMGCALFGGYFLLDNLQMLPISLGKKILLPVFLLLFGISLLADALRKSKRPKYGFSYNGKPHHGKDSPTSDYQIDEESFFFKASFNEQNQYISLPRLSHGEVNVSFGDYTVDLTGIEEVAENCTLDAHCAFGDLTLKIPSKFQVRSENSSAFASVDFKGKPGEAPTGTILLGCHVDFGAVTVEYI